jgi:hypothetical protein
MLAAPSPGAVGSCDKKDSPADLFAFCNAREELTCWRRGMRRELTEKAVNQCRIDASASCGKRVWAPECKPTQRVADACINALRAVDTVETREDKIPECKEKRLCTEQSSGDADSNGDSGDNS